MLIWVASYPRSGNRLFRTALQTGWRIRSETVFDDAERAKGTGEEAWEDPLSADVIAAARESEEPRFVKTHLVDHADTPDPAIVLIRDGRDALVSHARFTLAQAPRPPRRPEAALRRTISRLIETENRFGPWSRSVRAWRERPAPTAVVRFEELRSDPQRVAREALGAHGIEPGEPLRPMPSIETMRKHAPAELVGSGAVGGWREQLTSRQRARFAALHGELLVELGYATSSDPREW